MPPYEHLSVERDERGVVAVTFDASGRRVNVLDEELLGELASVLDDLETDAMLRLVVFRSGKESGFLAGADLHRIREITDAAQAEHILQRGQELLQRVERLPAPTIAVIHGACLGGGLEFALACGHRIIRNDAATRLGLPETQLGLIPAWGGTWRLPRTVGLSAAVHMIIEGNRLSAADAARIGLIDVALDSTVFEEAVTNFIAESLQGRERTPVSQTWPARLRDNTTLGQNLVLRLARWRIASRVGHNPALPAALRAISAGLSGGMDAGLAREREEFGRILFNPACRSLLELFFERERSRKPKKEE